MTTSGESSPQGRPGLVSDVGERLAAHDGTGRSSFVDMVERAVRTGARIVIVDVSDAEPLSSGTISALVSARRRGRSRGVRLMVRCRTALTRRQVAAIGAGCVQVPGPRGMPWG